MSVFHAISNRCVKSIALVLKRRTEDAVQADKAREHRKKRERCRAEINVDVRNVGKKLSGK